MHRALGKSLLAVTALFLAATVPAFAVDEAKILNVKADSVNNQVVLSLSHPTKMSLTAPLEKFGRLLILDIHDATLSDLAEKEAILNSVQAQMPDIAEVSLDEFHGNESLVRLVIKAKDSNLSGSLQSADTTQAVIQLVKPIADTAAIESSPASEPEKASEQGIVYKETKQDYSASSTTDDSVTIRPENNANPPAQLAGQTQININDPELKATKFEVETLRKERLKLESEVANLKILADKQRSMMGHIKEEQQKLAESNYNSTQKQTIISQQEQLTSWQKSHDSLQQVVGNDQATIADLQNRLGNSESQVKSLSEALDEKNKTGNAEDTISESVESFTTLSKLTPAEINKLVTAEKTFREGKKAEQKGDWKTAESQYKKALQLAPQVREYATSLAILYMNLKEFDKAQAVIEAALKYHPTDWTLLNEMGKIALLRKDDKMALTFFQKAMPSGVLSNYASTLRRVNKPQDAEFIYKLALSANPNDSDLLFNLGNLYLSLKRFDEAQSQYQAALRINPDFAEAHFHLGLAYAQQGKSQSAIDEMNTYLKLMPTASNKSDVQNYVKELSQISKS